MVLNRYGPLINNKNIHHCKTNTLIFNSASKIAKYISETDYALTYVFKSIADK